jgi:hypothetical protein
LQETKRSQNGALNVRYTWQAKQRYLDQFLSLLADRAPYCTVRYAF